MRLRYNGWHNTKALLPRLLLRAAPGVLLATGDGDGLHDDFFSKV